MNFKNIFLIIAMMIVSLQFVAAATLTCRQISSASLSIPQFSEKEIEIQCVASGGTVSNIQLTTNADPSTGLTIMSSQTISSSIGDSQSSTAKWTVKGDSPNDYTLQYTLMSDATSSWTGASTTEIDVPSPAQLVVEYVLPPSIFTPTVETLDVKINNIGGTTANNVKLKLNNDSKVDYPTTIAAGASVSYSWTNESGFNESGTYITRVYIGDSYQDSAETTVNSASDSDSINQTNGWNLISLSKEPADETVSVVLDSIDGSYDDVYAWNASGQNWMNYNALFPGFATFTKLNVSMGFWVRITAEDAELNVSGSDVSSMELTLYPGWNLIGYPLSTEKNISTVFASISGDYDDVWTFEGATPLEYNPLFPGFADFTQLEQTKGYWVRVTAQDAVIVTVE